MLRDAARLNPKMVTVVAGTCVLTGTVLLLFAAGRADPASANQSQSDSQAPTLQRSDDRSDKDSRAEHRIDHHVLSRPENVVWGGFPIDRPPIATVQSGDVVRIDARRNPARQARSARWNSSACSASSRRRS